jgi:hypothetical protein
MLQVREGGMENLLKLVIQVLLIQVTVEKVVVVKVAYKQVLEVQA